MQMCASCGGAIGEPGKTYGYAGKWCYCVKPIPNDYPHVTGFTELLKPGHVGELVHAPPALRPALPPEETLTPTAFVHWLRGYFAAGGAHTFTQGDWKRVAEELQKVKP